MGELRIAELRPGDVLLLRSPGPFAWAIRLLDGAEVDRAALVLGGGKVAEVEGEAVLVRPIEACLATAERAVARRLKEAVDMAPVLACAETLADAHVSARPEALLALLSISRKLRSTPSLRGLQQSALFAGTAALPKPSPLLGAQFVWRCFEDALPEAEDAYTVRLNGIRNLEVVSGVPVAPGMGVARRVSRGVHPESLLAWAAQPLVRSRLGAAPAAGSAAPLEETIAAVRAEVRDGATTPPLSRAEGDALLAALQAFAVALGGVDPPLARGVLPRPLEMLFRSAADLCTAGDLLRSEDLFTLE